MVKLDTYTKEKKKNRIKLEERKTDGKIGNKERKARKRIYNTCRIIIWKISFSSYD